MNLIKYKLNTVVGGGDKSIKEKKVRCYYHLNITSFSSHFFCIKYIAMKFSKTFFGNKSVELQFYKCNPFLPDPKLEGNILMLPSDFEGSISCLTKHLVSTGIRVHIPENHVGILLPIARHCSYSQFDAGDLVPRYIPSGFHNVIEVVLYNSCRHWWDIKHGDYVAQLVIVKTKKIHLHEIKV